MPIPFSKCEDALEKQVILKRQVTHMHHTMTLFYNLKGEDTKNTSCLHHHVANLTTKFWEFVNTYDLNQLQNSWFVMHLNGLFSYNNNAFVMHIDGFLCPIITWRMHLDGILFI